MPTTSPNMNLNIPVVGVDPSPTWATLINSCLTIIDGHNHTNGSGVAIVPGAININSDLPFNSNNATEIRATRFASQVSPIAASGSDVDELYVSGVDLYYNDGNGNQVRITQSGGVAGSPGSISNLTSPASASYVSANGKFVWQQDANTSADMDFGSAIMRNDTANSFALTLQPPTLGSNYSITLPPLPASQKIMTMDAAGLMSAPYTVDNTTIQISGNVLSVVVSAITPPGVIVSYGGTSAPSGWLLCDGTSYLQSTYSGLFAAIGAAYGSADGSHFNVPDFRGQFLRGVDGGTGRDPDTASRTAMSTGGNTGDNVGSVQSGQIVSHTHTASVTDPTHHHTYGSSSGGSDGILRDATSTNAASNLYNTSSAATGISVSNSSTGGNETRPTNAYVNFIIKT